MASNDYHFVTVWRIAATPDETTEVLGDAPGLARWWPSVYLTVCLPAQPPAVAARLIARNRAATS